MLKQLLKERNITQAALARQTGISQQYICTLAAGKHPMRPKTVARIGAAFDELGTPLTARELSALRKSALRKKPGKWLNLERVCLVIIIVSALVVVGVKVAG